MSITPMIHIKDVTKKYKNIMLTYNNITIHKRITLLLGENGSGKSTLLKAIMNGIKYTGEISIVGTYSYMPEVPSFPVDTTVDSFLKTLSPQVEHHELLAMFHLTQKQDALISTLSKGMKAKLNVIQCLMEDVDWYLLDEPLSGLDYDGLSTLIQYISRSKKRFIIATHLQAAFQSLEMDVILIG